MCINDTQKIICILKLYPHWQKSWENHEKKTENFPQFSRNENLFVKIGELFSFWENWGKCYVPSFKFSHDFCQCKTLYSILLVNDK